VQLQQWIAAALEAGLNFHTVCSGAVRGAYRETRFSAGRFTAQ